MTFQVCLVYKDEIDYAVLRNFCEEHSIQYNARPFNSSKYVIDRENIARLPAIHIIESGSWLDTIYPSIQALHTVENYHARYAKQQNRKYTPIKWIGRWLFSRRLLKTDSVRPSLSVSTN